MPILALCSQLQSPTNSHIHETVDIVQAKSVSFTVIERSLDVIDGYRRKISLGQILKQPHTAGVIVIAIGEGCPHADHNQRYVDSYARTLEKYGVKTIVLFNCTETGAKKFFDRYQSPVAFAVDGNLTSQKKMGLEFSNSCIVLKADGSLVKGKPKDVRSYKFLPDGCHPFVQSSVDTVVAELLGKDMVASIREEVLKVATPPKDYELGCPLGKCGHGL